MPILIKGFPHDFSDVPPDALLTTADIMRRRFTKAQSSLDADIKRGRFPRPVTAFHQKRFWRASDIHAFFGVTYAPEQK